MVVSMPVAGLAAGAGRRRAELGAGQPLAGRDLHRHRHAGVLAGVRQPAARPARPHRRRDRSRRRGRLDDRARRAGRAVLLVPRPRVAYLVVFRAVQRSHIGWAFRALRDDEVAAELAGVDVTRYRVGAGLLGSAMLGVAGALYAHSEGFIAPSTFAFGNVDVRVLVMVAFGGIGTLLGPVVGAAAFTIVDESLESFNEYRLIIYGTVILVLFLGFKRGVVPAVLSLVAGAGAPGASARPAGGPSRHPSVERRNSRTSTRPCRSCPPGTTSCGSPRRCRGGPGRSTCTNCWSGCSSRDGSVSRPRASCAPTCRGRWPNRRSPTGSRSSPPRKAPSRHPRRPRRRHAAPPATSPAPIAPSCSACTVSTIGRGSPRWKTDELQAMALRLIEDPAFVAAVREALEG